MDPTSGSSVETIVTSATADNPTGVISQRVTNADGITVATTPWGINNLSGAAQAFNDAHALLQALRNHQPLPALGSGLRLANDLTGNQVPALGIAGGAIGTVTSLQQFYDSLKHGDTGGTVLGAANVFVQGTDTFVASVYGGSQNEAVADGLGGENYFEEAMQCECVC